MSTKKVSIGITGTRNGMTSYQKSSFARLIGIGLWSIKEFHHGMCMGVDTEAHDIIRSLVKFRGVPIVGHPSTLKNTYVPSLVDEILLPLPPLERNRAIVDAADILIALPSGEEVLRSGTWATVRCARLKRIYIVKIAPTGRITYEVFSKVE